MKLAFLLRDLGPNQLAHDVISAGNRLVARNERVDVTVMYEALTRPCMPYHFACSQLAEGWGFDGAVVATSLSTAAKLIGMPSARPKAFMVWDLEWLRPGNYSFRANYSVYAHPDLKLLTRSEEHAWAIGQAWGKNAAIVPDFDSERLLEALRG